MTPRAFVVVALAGAAWLGPARVGAEEPGSTGVAALDVAPGGSLAAPDAAAAPAPAMCRKVVLGPCSPGDRRPKRAPAAKPATARRRTKVAAPAAAPGPTAPPPPILEAALREPATPPEPAAPAPQADGAGELGAAAASASAPVPDAAAAPDASPPGEPRAAPPGEAPRPPGPWSRDPVLDFSRQHWTLSRQAHGVRAFSLYDPVPPPEVLAKDFGLLVERRFGL